jgi:hypothetical protein
MPAPSTLSGFSRPVAAVWLCALVLSGCGGDSTDTRRVIASVAVTPNPASVEVGETVQLTATVRDDNGAVVTDCAVTWSSGSAATATVDANGLVTGVSVGTVTITATCEGVQGSSSVTAAEADLGFGAFVGGGGKIKLNQVSSYWTSSFTGYWVTVPLTVPLPPTSQGIAFRAAATPGSLTSSALFAGGYEGTGSSATRDAVLIFPASNTAVGLQMTAARLYPTITPLAGSRALIAGGIDGDVVLSSAEIFTESTREFAATGAMGTARTSHAAAELPDGRVLITGGLIPVGSGPATTDAASTEIFDPTSGTFSPANDMTVTRFNHSAVALDDGRVLVLGGNNRRNAEVYDPDTGDFTAVEDMESVRGNGHQAVKLLDGRVLVVGGDTAVIQPTASAEVFDPATNQFTAVGSMSTPRMLHFAVLLDDGTVLVGGGQDDTGDVLASAERFNPATNTFTPVSDMPLSGSEQAAVPITR